MSISSLEIFDDIAIVVSIAGSVIVIWSVLVAILSLVKLEVAKVMGRDNANQDMELVRINFSRYLLLSLDFMLAADIIHTIHSPELKELYVLALIVAIRSVISFFLTKEIRASGEGKCH